MPCKKLADAFTDDSVPSDVLENQPANNTSMDIAGQSPCDAWNPLPSSDFRLPSTCSIPVCWAHIHASALGIHVHEQLATSLEAPGYLDRDGLHTGARCTCTQYIAIPGCRGQPNIQLPLSPKRRGGRATIAQRLTRRREEGKTMTARMKALVRAAELARRAAATGTTLDTAQLEPAFVNVLVWNAYIFHIYMRARYAAATCTPVGPDGNEKKGTPVGVVYRAQGSALGSWEDRPPAA
eukprot:5604293-Pyramimonas_sp.AAC.1